MKKCLLAGLLALMSSSVLAVVSNDGWFVDEATVKRAASGALSYEAVMMAGVSDYVVRVKDGKPNLFITNKATGKPEPVDDADTLEMFKQARAGLEKQMK